MDRVRIGVLSHAHGHANTYCQVMRDFPDVKLVASWDDDQPRGRQAAQAYGLEFRADADEVIKDPRIDALIIACETNRHAEFAERAATAGKHILLQKPMATTLEDCDRIAAAVRRSGVKFSMAFQMRQDPVNRKMKQLLDEGAVGRIFLVRRRHTINVLLNPAFGTGGTRWHVDPVANVGMFFDDATHAADWFYWMLGAPRSVTAEIDNILGSNAPDDNGVALYRFAKGEIGVLLNSSTTVSGVNTTEIYGDQGTIIQDFGDAPSTAAPRHADSAPLRLIRRDEKHWTEFRLPIPASQGERIAAVPRPFIDYLRGLSDLTISPEEGRVSVEMVLGAYRSAAEGRRIGLPL
ncbi:MAG: Gfo/Idh/MocA family oxidoreductase [Candidatus Latescibacteria bacterium]|nr:Gfo/Idh/MocA family oxidoreductase [Candidatus Latescibacterota bacterium]